MQRAYPIATGRSGKTKEDYRVYVGTLMSLRVSLGIRALAGLLGVDPANVRKAIGGLSSVLSISDSDVALVTPYHTSFREFLLSLSSDPESPLSMYIIPALDRETNLALRCLDIMNSPALCFNICRVPNPFVKNDSIEDLAQRLDEYVPSHLQYASLYWAEHLVEIPYSDELHAYLRIWCETKMMFYLELLSLLGRCDVALPLLDDAISWLKVCYHSFAVEYAVRNLTSQITS